jgi:hypothetical protein
MGGRGRKKHWFLPEAAATFRLLPCNDRFRALLAWLGPANASGKKSSTAPASLLREQLEKDNDSWKETALFNNQH